MQARTALGWLLDGAPRGSLYAQVPRNHRDAAMRGFEIHSAVRGSFAMQYGLRSFLSTVLVTSCLVACGPFVDVVKTGNDVREATDPNSVEILRTQPQRDFEQLGTVAASGFALDESAKMHDALRINSALLGAHAIVILREGVLYRGFGDYTRWATGMAIRYK
jgi:hypothetical protein